MIPTDLQQRWPAPTDPRPIVFIGAGGIINDAHLPAYHAMKLAIAGVFDPDQPRAAALAGKWDIPTVFASLDEALASPDAVIDVAVPPTSAFDVVRQIPQGRTVLIQKPLGPDLPAATAILDICRSRDLIAAVNLQLRYSPMMLALRDAIARGLLGRIIECEVHVNCHQPWELWPFMKTLEHMEIAMHSIHYLDAVRSVMGDPPAVYARTVQHPAAIDLKSTRTSAILDYGLDIRCCLSVNHHHTFGRRHQFSHIRFEGDRGAAVLKMGVNLNYPLGEPDDLEICLIGGEWQKVNLVGSWFPDAFRGPMSNLQRFAAGEDDELLTRVDDAWKTMALVEACYRSDARGGEPVADLAGT